MATLKDMFKVFDDYGEVAKKTMDMTDTYTNITARMKAMNSTTKDQIELQKKLFAASNRSRSSYEDMVNAVAKLNLSAKSGFGNDDEAIGFTELLQKSLKLSGIGENQQNSAFSKITQAMSSGKLQGDDFSSIMENAPMVADAISMYSGKTKEELSGMASEGGIAADTVKRAMFMAANDINNKFAEAPMTFSSVWDRIKNAGVEAFGGVFDKINAILNSDMGQSAINNLIGVIYMAAIGFNILFNAIGWAVNNLDIIGPIIMAIAGAWLVYNAVSGIAWLTTLKSARTTVSKTIADWAEYAAIFALIWAQEGFNAAVAACPIAWIVTAIVILIAVFYLAVAAVNRFAGTSLSATGLIGAAFGVFVANLYNTFVFPFWNDLAMLGNFIGNVFNNPVGAVKVLFLDMANTCISYILNMAKAIENVINKIPGVKIDITSGLDSLKSGIEEKTKEIKDETGWKEYIKQPELMDISGAAASGYSKGEALADKASNLFSSFSPGLGAGSNFGLGTDSNSGLGAGLDLGLDASSNLGLGTGSALGSSPAMDFSQFATAGNPASVKGTGSSGAVKVENEEDTEWMRKLAERDYVARISQNTLAPSIKVEFTGPITKEADVDGIASHLGNILKEQIAIAPEGVYA